MGRTRRAAIGSGGALVLGGALALHNALALGCGRGDRVVLEGAPASSPAPGDAGEPSAAGASGGSSAEVPRVREGLPGVEGLDRAAADGARLDGGSGADGRAPDDSEPDDSEPDDSEPGGSAGGSAVDGSPAGGAPGSADTGSDTPGPGSSAAGAPGNAVSGGAGNAASGGAGSAEEPEAPAGPVVVNLTPSSLALFAPPIDSTRYAVAGYDAAADVCVSIIWDYSNNDLELARHCDDFGVYASFPYVLVRPGLAASCASLWGYGGLAPSAAEGCIDPIEGLVNVRLEVEAEGTRYLIRALNEPPSSPAP